MDRSGPLLPAQCRDVMTQIPEVTSDDHLTQSAVPHEFRADVFANLANISWANTAVNRELCYKALSAASNVELDETLQQQRSRFLTAVAKAGLLNHSDLSSRLVETALHRGDVRLVKGLLAHVEITWGNSYLKIACKQGNADIAELLLAKGASTTGHELYHNPLYLAYMNGHVELAKKLLNHPLGLEEAEASDMLSAACGTNDYEFIDQLLNKTHLKPIESKQLTIACKAGHREAVQVLLKHGANPNGTPNEPLRPLTLACSNGYYALAQDLIMAKACLDGCEGEGSTPLFEAIRNHDLNMVHLLLDSGALIDGRKTMPTSPLAVAATLVHTDTINALLNRGASIDGKAHDLKSPLSVACNSNNRATLELLLERGAAIEGLRSQKSSPLMNACDRGHVDLVEYLLQKGAKVDGLHMAVTEYASSFTPLSRASFKGHNQIIEILLAYGASLEGHPSFENRPLTLACASGFMSTVLLLLGKGAAINLDGDDKMTPLMGACTYEHQDLCAFLLEQGAENDPDSDVSWPMEGLLCLHEGSYNLDDEEQQRELLALSTRFKDKKYFERLVSEGVDINSIDETGRTVLHELYLRGAPEKAQWLIDAGANSAVTDYKGYTPQDLYHQFQFNQRCSVNQASFNYGVRADLKIPLAPAHANRNVLLELTKQVPGAAEYATGITKMFTHVDENTPYIGTPSDPLERRSWYQELDNYFKLIALEIPQKLPAVQASVLRELHEASSFCGGAWSDEGRGQHQVVTDDMDNFLADRDPMTRLHTILTDYKRGVLTQLVHKYVSMGFADERHMNIYLHRTFGPKLGIPGTLSPVQDVYEPEVLKLLESVHVINVTKDFSIQYNPADIAVWLEESIPARMKTQKLAETFGPFLEDWVSTHPEEVAAIVGTDLATFKKDLAEDLDWVANHCFKSLQSPKNPGSLSFLGVQLLLLATEVVEQNQRVEVVVGEAQVELDLRYS